MNARVANHLGALCIASALVAVVAPSSASATTRQSATGNPATIAFYRKVVQATRSVDAFRMTFGVVDTRMAVKNDGGGGLSWVQDGPMPAGYEPAEGVIWVGQAGGRVQFVAETVTPGRGSGASFPSFGLVLTPRGEIMLAGGAEPSSVGSDVSGVYQPCDGTTTGSPYVGGYSKTGVPGGGHAIYGHFLAMKRLGNTVVVTSTFPWGSQKATEIDRISATTYLPSRTIIHVSAGRGGAAYASFTIAYTDSWYHTPISPPNSTGICASYLKSIR